MGGVAGTGAPLPANVNANKGKPQKADLVRSPPALRVFCNESRLLDSVPGTSPRGSGVFIEKCDYH